MNSISFPALTAVGGTLSIYSIMLMKEAGETKSCLRMDFPVLEIIGANLDIDNVERLAHLGLPLLRRVSGTLSIDLDTPDAAAVLPELSFPALEYIGGGLEIADLPPTLTDLSFPELAEIGEGLKVFSDARRERCGGQ